MPASVPPPAALPNGEFAYIPDLPGYCASRAGRVFSCVRWGTWRECRWHKVDSNFYVYTFVDGRSRPRRVKVIDLVAAAFLGPCPDGHCVIMIDKRRSNTAVDNLRYGTIDEALRYYGVHGERLGNVSVTAAEVVAFRQRVHAHVVAGESVPWAAEAAVLDCTVENAKAIAKGLTWRHVSAGVPYWQPSPRPATPGNSKLSEADVRAIAGRLARGEGVPSVQRSYPQVTTRTIESIKYGESWGHVTNIPRREAAR